MESSLIFHYELQTLAFERNLIINNRTDQWIHNKYAKHS